MSHAAGFEVAILRNALFQFEVRESNLIIASLM